MNDAPQRTAQRLADFAPEAIAPYLEHVWLGVPEVAAEAGDDAVRIPLSSLGEHRDALLDAMTCHYGGDAELHARALLSQWSKYYFGLAAPAGVVAARLLRRPLDMSLERSRLVLRAGMPAALHFSADALKDPVDDPALRYAGLIDHLHGVIENRAARAVEQRRESARLSAWPVSATARHARRRCGVALRSRRCRGRTQSAAHAGARNDTPLGAAAEPVSRAPRVLRSL
jgi:ferric iron reductase protein FhuF